MNYQGDFATGATVYVYFNTFDSNDPSASVTLTGLAASDIEIYKNGSAIQRTSDSGYTLLDTDGIDFDGITGVHGFSIDLSDNTDAGFFAAGNEYAVVVSSVTVYAATVNFAAATFSIERTSGAIAQLKAMLDGNNRVDVGSWLGTAVTTSATTSLPEVDAKSISDNAAAADNVQANIGNLDAPVSTVDTVVDGIKAVTDNLPDSGALSTIDGNVDAILVDTGTTLENHLTDIKGTSFVKDTHSLIDIETYVDLIDDGTSGLAKIATDVAAVLVDTADMQPKLGTPAADVSADIAAVKAETALIVADTGTDGVLVAGTPDVNVAQISGSTTAADNLEASALGIVPGAVNDASATTTTFVADGFTEATDDHFNGRIIVFTSGALAGQASDITDYTGGTQTFTVTALTEAPADNVTFVIV